MNYLSQMLRDCSKNKPSTFSDISFPLMNEIQNKLKYKKQSLRRRYRIRFAERERMLRATDESRQEMSSSGRGIKIFYNKVDNEQINYLEVYKTPIIQNEGNDLICIPKGKLEQKDEEITYQIYQLLRKRKNIFKVQQVKRKLKSNQSRRSLWSRHRTIHLQKNIDREQEKSMKMEDIQLPNQNQISEPDEQSQSPEEAVKISSEPEPIEDINIVEKEESIVDQMEKKENIVQLAEIEPIKEKVENKEECINQTIAQNQIILKTQNKPEILQPQIKQQNLGKV